MRDEITSPALATTDDYESRSARGQVAQTPPGDRGEPAWPGRVLGDFVLGAVLGRGGFGTVYQAEQRSLARPAVVKVSHRPLAAHRDGVERFAREARLAAHF